MEKVLPSDRCNELVIHLGALIELDVSEYRLYRDFDIKLKDDSSHLVVGDFRPRQNFQRFYSKGSGPIQPCTMFIELDRDLFIDYEQQTQEEREETKDYILEVVAIFKEQIRINHRGATRWNYHLYAWMEVQDVSGDRPSHMTFGMVYQFN